MDVLTLIPARGGSKGIKNKNIIDLCGKPLISYTIEAALEAELVNDEFIWCSTDSEEISKVAEKHGAKVPFYRPDEYATDEASSVSVVLHALNWAKENKLEFDYLLLLQPTSPFRKAEDIDKVIRLMKKKEADSIISVTKADIMPFNMKYMDRNGELSDFIDDDYNRRQDMPKVYGTNGAIYLTKTNIIFNEENFYGKKSIGYLMDRENSIDIDTYFDLKIAKLLMSENKDN